MYATLGVLARLVATPAREVSTGTVVAACECVRELLGAEDAYVIRAGDPAFIRLGSDEDPAAYEIKQRGYWHAWREAAAHPESPARCLTVANRLVEELLPLEAGVPATHIAAILPGDESNSEVLIVRGPWAVGLSDEQVQLVSTVRPLMAYLVANVLDGARHERLRSEMKVLANIAESLSHADEADGAMGALATALARVSGFAWVAILLFDPSIERVVDRAVNIGRHSNTETAAQGRQGQESEHSVERDIRVARHVAWTRQPYCVPDVSDSAEQMLVDDELRPYYERAHIISMASFPVYVQDQMLGTITFCGSEQHAFEQAEQDFLWTLVAQAGPTIKAFRLNSELRQAEQRLRAVFQNAPVFITVFGPDGTILLSEGAGLDGLGQLPGEMVGRNVYDMVPAPYRAGFQANVARGMAGEQFETDLTLNHRNFQTRYAALRDDDNEPTGVIAVTLDVSAQRHAQRELETLNQELQGAKEKAEALAREAEHSRQRAEYLARHDALTGVLSRRAWFEVAGSTRPTAIAVFDIDNFKAINDRFGHPAGDVVLRNVAERMAGAIQGDGVLGRLGGEEFGVVFAIPAAEAERVCRRAVELVGVMPCLLPGGTLLSVTVSAGLAACEREDDQVVDGIARAYDLADRALYDAKAAGRHRLVVARAA